METDEQIVRFINFDASDIDRIRQLREELSVELDDLVAETCRELSVDADGEATEALQRAISEWLERMFAEPFSRRREPVSGELEEMVHASSPWTECLLATLHRLRRHLGRHIHESPDFDPSGRRESFRASLEKAFDFEVLRLVRARHRADIRGRVEHMATLAAGLSHEIYNPLNSISLHLSLLERQLQAGAGERDGQDDDGPGFSTVLTAVREELRRIGNFTSELSDFSRPLPVRSVRLDGEAFLSDFVETHAPTLATAGVELSWSAPEEASREIEADPDLLEEALLNLVQNAVEAMETAGSIELKLTSAPGATHLDVVDSGPGFVEEAADRAFDLFFSTKAAGTGLGLPLVRKIARAHGGGVQVLPRPDGDGAALRVTLPRTSAEAAEGDDEPDLQELQSFSQY
jgi:signal transduction histidine kinase